MSKYSQNMPADTQSAIRWMYPHIKPNSVFLDFGCSTGYFGSLIKQDKNCKVYGLEISKDIVEAKKVLDGVYSFDLDGKWPEKVYERKYDYLFFGDVLEHLKDPGVTLQKCQRLLTKNGKIFVSVPNVAHMSIRLELLSGNFEYEPMGILDNTHLKYFTLRSFSEMATQAGYALTLEDCTLNDYPTEVITKLLRKAGVTPTPAFWNIADTTEARAFQYKFVLTPSTNKASSVGAKTVKKPSRSRDDYVDDLQVKVKNLSKHAEEQAEVIEHYRQRSEELEARNKNLLGELQGKATNKLKSATRSVLRRIKRR